MDQGIDKKRIIKNTILLYGRMVLSLLINLYCSRVVLQTLGVIDYGVFNVVGGVIVLFTFISGAGAVVYFSGAGGYDGSQTTYGSFLLPGSAGGYVLAAVVSFTVGVALTLFLLMRRRKNGGDFTDESKEDDDAKD